MNVKRYCLGFAFEKTGLQEVLLIKKTKPEWQRGMLNGVGGSIEPGETSLDAMIREFYEETHEGTEPSEWREFATLVCPDVRVVCFSGCISYFDPWRGNPNGEVARWRSLYTPNSVNWIPNLNWLIPMARLKWSCPYWEDPVLIQTNKQNCY